MYSHNRGRAGLVGLLVVFSMTAVGGLAPVVSGAEHVSVTQTPGMADAAPATNVTFVVDLDVPDEYNAPAVDVDLPASWDIVAQSSTGRYRASEHQWVWLEGGDKSVEFTVRVPADAAAGTYQVLAEGSAVHPDTDEIELARTESTVDVASEAGSTGSTATATSSPTWTPTTAHETDEGGAANTSTPPTGTPSPTEPSSPSPTENVLVTAEPTPRPTATSTVRGTTVSSSGQPGFGADAAVLALLVSALIGGRRYLAR